MRLLVHHLLIGTMLAAAGCGAPKPPPSPTRASGKTTAEAGAACISAQRMTVTASPVNGLSDLARDDRGILWSIAERDPMLIALRVGRTDAVVSDTVTLQSMPPDTDTESLAWLGENLFACGTEQHTNGRASDDVLIFRKQGNIARLEQRLAVPYALWGRHAQDNRGIEALCHAAGHLIVAVEASGQAQGKRFAPLARYDLATRAWHPYQLLLTSQQGVISAISCWRASQPDRIEVVAIERYYETSRLLRFSLLLSAQAQQIRPRVLVDLATLARQDVPNWEGVARLSENRYLLIADNQLGDRLQGPVEILRLSVTAEAK